MILKKDNLGALIKSVEAAGAIFIAPVTEADYVRYSPVGDASNIESDYVIPKNSVKEYMFPQTETIAEFRVLKESVEMEATPVNAPETVIFGSRPCDASSLASLRSVFTWDFIDESYTKREENSVLISVACVNGDAACFCTSVGLAPDVTDGSDLMLKETEDGDFAVEAVSDRGKAFVKKHKKVFDDKKAGKTKAIFAPVELDIDIEKIGERLKDRSHYDDPMWTEFSRKCFGCGSCTYACPTCHCFDITDEGSAYSSERKKNWDACQFDHFTLHAAGHNPRDTQAKRWRNRFMCKFNFYPEKFSSKGCVGCGRCVRVCPVRHDITEVMEALSK